jgi:heptosyltransferase-1
MSIDALAQQLSKAKFVIGVDSGLTHLASALDIPTLALFMHSHPNLTGIKNPIAIAENIGSYSQNPHIDEVIKKFEDLA